MKQKTRMRLYTVTIVFTLIFCIFGTVFNFPIKNIQAADNWYDNSYNYRQLITINSSQVVSTLTNFPVLINVDSDSDLSLHAQTDGDDIFFIDYDDNSTQYNHEVEHYSAGTLQAWVNITSLSSSADTLVWIYYGNSSVGSQENVAGTWDSNYTGVWHLDDNDLTDSTSNGYDATTSGTADSNNGAVAGCREFSKTNGENISVDPWGGTGNYSTVECWINNGDSLAEQNYPRYVIQGETWNSNSDWCAYGRPNDATPDKGFRCTYNVTIGSAAQGGTHPQGANYWWYMTYSINESDNSGNGRQTIRANKTEQHDTWLAGEKNSDTYAYLTFGNDRSAAAASSFDGYMDEFRVSNVNRTTAWLDTTYNTIALSSAFQYISIGEEELVALGGAPIISAPIPADEAVSIQLQPNVYALLNDPDDDDMNVSFYENTTGSWVLQENFTGIANHTIVGFGAYVNASEYNTKYYWSVNCTDGTYWDNKTFSFTTVHSLPILGTPSPANGSTGNPTELVWSIQVNDTEGDTISWTIECSNGQSNEGSGQPPYNTPTLADTDLFVEKWDVTTAELGHSISAEPVTADINGDGIEEIFTGGRPINYDYLTDQWAFMTCLDGATGAEIWQVNFTVDYFDKDGIGSSSNQHWCPMIYDFVPSNPGLEITWSSGMKYHRMYDAETGNVGDNPPWLWNTSAFAGGWHNVGYMDDGTDVFLYIVEGVGSIQPYARDGYDPVTNPWGDLNEGLVKAYANNGTLIAQTTHLYECFGGAAIADINDDGVYEVLITDRKNDTSNPNDDDWYRGIACYDEDLNFLWNYEESTFSTQCAAIADVDDDGDLEVILMSQSGANYGRAVVFSGDPSGSVGEIEFTSLSLGSAHHQVAIGNTDDDANLEIVNTGSTGGGTYVYDFIDNTRYTIASSGATNNADIMDIVVDDGVQINEILCMEIDGVDDNMLVYQYNTSTTNYDKVFEFLSLGTNAVVSDVDFDGYKELVLNFNNRLEVWETNVTIQDPKPITNVAFNGMRRLNNDEFVHPPGYYEFITYGEDNGTKNLSLENLELDTEYTVYVNVTDSGSGLWNRSTFTFSTLGIVNQSVLFKNPDPSNNSVDNPLSLIYQLTIEDPEGDTFNWSIECNGVSNSSNTDTNGTKNLTLSGLGYSTTYTVYVNATDIVNLTAVNETFSFTTIAANTLPDFTNPTPANNSYNNATSIDWSIFINDSDADLFNWTIECNNSQGSAWNDSRYFGSDGSYQTGLQSFEDDLIGIPWKMDSNTSGIATNISINIGCGGQSFKVKAALYDEDRYYIGETEEIIIEIGAPTWQVLNLTDNILLIVNTTYYIVAFMNQSDTPSHWCSIRWENESGDNAGVWALLNYGYGEFPEFEYNTSAVMWGDASRTLHMKCNYYSNGEGTKNLSLTALASGSEYTVWVNATDSGGWNRSIYYFYNDLDMAVTTNASTNITYGSAILNGYLDYGDGEICNVSFNYGETEAYGTSIFDLDPLYSPYELLETDTFEIVGSRRYGLCTDGTNFWSTGATGDSTVYKYDMDMNFVDSWAAAFSSASVTVDSNYIYLMQQTSPYKVYKYTKAGSLIGSYSTGIPSSPNGIAARSNGTDADYIWISTGGTAYQYTTDFTTTGVTATKNGGYILREIVVVGNYLYMLLSDDLLEQHYTSGEYTGFSYDIDSAPFDYGWMDSLAHANYTFYIQNYNTKNYIHELKYRLYADEGDTFNCLIDGLTAGQLYHYQVVANNSRDMVFGEDSAFLTKPKLLTAASIVREDQSLNLSWAIGTGANTTYVERNTSGVTSWARGAGTQIYNGTGTYFVDTSLVNESTYYYQIWSYANWTYNPTIHQWSANYSSLNLTMVANPGIQTNAATGVGATSATLQGYVVSDGGDPNDCTVWFEYGTSTGYGTNTSDQTKSTGNSFTAAGSLTAGTFYHYRAVGNNSISMAYGSNTVFLSRPSTPTSFTASRLENNITLNWGKGTGANNTYIERDTSPTWSRGAGLEVYNNTGTGYLDSGLAEGVTYYYQAWAYTEWTSGGSDYYQYSSSYASAAATANAIPVFTNLIPVHNGTIDIGLYPGGAYLSIDIEDPDGDTFNWSIETSPDIGSNSTTGDSNGTKTCGISPLVNVSYYWFVNCTDSYGSTNASYNFTIENSDVTPPILDTVNITGSSGFNASLIGYINLSAHDDASAAIIVNITINGETFNESISNPGQTATYAFNLSITGKNLLTVLLTDDFGNSYTYQQTHTIYFVNCTLVNERTGEVFNWANAKTVGGMLTCNVTVPGKAYRLDLYTNENTSFYYISTDQDILRFEFSYSNVTTVVIRSFSIDLLDHISNIGLVEVETEFYEQLIYSTGSKPVVVKNVYSNSFIETGYTAHAYGSTFTLSALTIDMLYYLYTSEDGHTVFLASIEGSRTAQINLDFLDHVNVTYSFTILSDGVGIARYDTDSIVIYYLNSDNDNSKLDIEIYDGTRLVFSHTEFLSPNEVTVYFNYGAINLTEDMLELRFTAYDEDGNAVVTSRFFSISTLSESPMIPAGIAAIIAVLLAIFGFTFVSTKHVFGFFGIFAIVAGLGLTAFAEQIWYIRLIQVVLVILLAFVILIFKEESATVIS